MVEMTSKIKLESTKLEKPLVFGMCESVAIRSSWKTIEDTAVVRLPNLNQWFDIDLFPLGTIIRIDLGYNEEYNREFEGYVTELHPKNGSIELKCEDRAYRLKRSKVTPKSWKSIQLSELIEYIDPKIVFAGNDATLTNFRLEEVTKYEALRQIKQSYGLVVYYRGKDLYVGLAYNDPATLDMDPVIYHFQKNAIIEGRNLEFKRSEDIHIRFKGISVTEKTVNGKRKMERIVYETESSSANAGVHTLHYTGKTEAELKAFVDEELKRVKFDGLHGSFIGKGLPIPEHSQVVDIRDDRRKEFNGKYFIDEILVTYDGRRGFNRKIIPGRKVA